MPQLPPLSLSLLSQDEPSLRWPHQEGKPHHDARASTTSVAPHASCRAAPTHPPAAGGPALLTSLLVLSFSTLVFNH